jgi:uncharacterized iron-regulated protein
MKRVCAAVLMGLLGGCASTGPGERPAGDATPLDPRGVEVFEGHAGAGAAWGEVVEAAAGADVVIIGETHGHGQGLAAAAALWEDLLSREGLSPALSLEFFDRGTQAALDDYLLGVVDEAKFREAAGRSEGNYPAGHRAMVEAAKAAGAPVIAANAPRRYSSMAREDGFESLDGLRASQRALVAWPAALPAGPYRDRFFEQMGGMLASHGGDEELSEEELNQRVEGYFRAQSVWDETMASSIVHALSEGRRPVVHVVGRFHSDFNGGLVQALWRARPGTRVVTLSMVEDADPAGEDAGRADFVVRLGPAE